MSLIRQTGSIIEKTLGKALWKKGLRYRKHYKKLIGKPDFVLVKHKIAIFCDSEFWHGYNWKNYKKKIKTNSDFWIRKVERNMERDRIVNKTLKTQGWRIFRFWGKKILRGTDDCITKILEAIND